MNFACVIFAAAMLASPAPVLAQTTLNAPAPAAVVYAREIVTLLSSDERHKAQEEQSRPYFEQLRDAMATRYSDAGVRQIVGDYINGLSRRVRLIAERHRPIAREALVQAYAREFSLEELQQIAGFIRTDAGKHLFTRTSAIQADPGVIAATQSYMMEVTRLFATSQSEMEAAAEAYLSKHPEAHPRNGK